MKRANKFPKAGPDEVYSQLYQEMCRYRDYELTTSTWHMLLLLGILGLVLNTVYGGNPKCLSVLAKSFKAQPLVQYGTAVLFTSVGASCLYSILYSNIRYHDLRMFTDQLEPKWKDSLKRNKIGFPTVNVIYFILLLLVTVGNSLILLELELCIRTVAAVSCFLVGVLAFFFLKPKGSGKKSAIDAIKLQDDILSHKLSKEQLVKKYDTDENYLKGASINYPGSLRFCRTLSLGII